MVSLSDLQNASARLVIRGLKKHYRSHSKTVEAVKGISIEVKGGECYGLLGPNGAGKSTSINCITGFFPPSEGNVLIDGIDVHLKPKQARQNLGVCQQEDTLDSDFDCLDQLVRHGAYYRIPARVARPRALELLNRLGLGDNQKSEVGELSGGMRRKLQVARALVSDPAVMVLDEPTTGLDPEARRTLWEILAEYRKKGNALLISTHYMDEAERLCDRVGIMEKGKILAEGSPQALILKYVGSDPIEEEIRPGVKWRRAPNLEDVFLKLTGHGLSGDAK